MTLLRKAAVLLLAAALSMIGYAWWHTRLPPVVPKAPGLSKALTIQDIDQSTFATAKQLAALAVSADGRTFSQSALHLADHELDLAFNAALLSVQGLVAADAAARDEEKDALDDELQLAQSQLELDKDEVEEANDDLRAAGGDPQQRIQTLINEHDNLQKAAAEKSAESMPPRIEIGGMVADWAHGSSYAANRSIWPFDLRTKLYQSAVDLPAASG